MSRARPRDEDTGTSGHAGRRPQLAKSPGSYIPGKLPWSWRGDLRSAAYATDVRDAVHATTVAAERGVAGWTFGRAERCRPVPAQLSILPSGRRHGITPGD